MIIEIKEHYVVADDDVWFPPSVTVVAEVEKLTEKRSVWFVRTTLSRSALKNLDGVIKVRHTPIPDWRKYIKVQRQVRK